MSKSIISVFLPILFAALAICAIVLCSCAFCHGQNSMPGYRGGSSIRSESDLESNNGHGGEVLEVEQESVGSASYPGGFPGGNALGDGGRFNAVPPAGEAIRVVDAVHPDLDWQSQSGDGQRDGKPHQRFLNLFWEAVRRNGHNEICLWQGHVHPFLLGAIIPHFPLLWSQQS